MSALSDLRKSLDPLKHDLERHRATLIEGYQQRHARYMELNAELQALRALPPSAGEVERVVDEFLETFLSRHREELSRMLGPARACDCPERQEAGRKNALSLLHGDSKWSAISALMGPSLRANIAAAVAGLGWEFGPPAAERCAAIAALERQIQEVVAEMDEITGLGGGIVQDWPR